MATTKSPKTIKSLFLSSKKKQTKMSKMHLRKMQTTKENKVQTISILANL